MKRREFCRNSVLTAGLAEDIPSDVIALGKKSILDGLGLALAGFVDPGAVPAT